MAEPPGGPEIVDLLWCVIGACVRGNVKWRKMALLYSERGDNSKGTLCELIRQVVGVGRCASIPLSLFGQNFQQEPLTKAKTIVVDENDVGVFIDRASTL